MDPLAIFDDENFNAVSIVDSFCSGNDDLEKTGLLTTQISKIMTSLSFYQNSINSDLQAGLKGLEKASGKVGYFDDDDDGADNVTRLQYHVDQIINSVHSLRIKSEQVASAGKTGVAAPINKLVELSKIQQRLNHVLKMFDTASFVASISSAEAAEAQQLAPTGGTNEPRDVVTPKTFKASLDVLEELLIEQLEMDELMDVNSKISTLLQLKGFFKGLGVYDEMYDGFARRLEAKQRETEKQEKRDKHRDHSAVKDAQEAKEVEDTVEEKKGEVENGKDMAKENTGFGFMNFFN